MSYVGNNLALMETTIEGLFSIFFYQTVDTISEVLASDYFEDGIVRGMDVGDIVFAVTGGVPYILYVESAGEGGCTVTPTTLAVFNGNSLPTVSPPNGSGLLWNNGGFLCIA